MADIEYDLVTQAIETLMDETLSGPKRANWILNQGDIGLLGTLRRMTPEQATQHPIPHRACAAGHAHHISFHLNLLNRAYKGEPAFANADWAGSWMVGELTEDTWRSLLDRLESEAIELKAALSRRPDLDNATALTGTMAAVVHLGYHLGAVRQLVALVK